MLRDSTSTPRALESSTSSPRGACAYRRPPLWVRNQSRLSACCWWRRARIPANQLPLVTAGTAAAELLNRFSGIEPVPELVDAGALPAVLRDADQRCLEFLQTHAADPLPSMAGRARLAFDPRATRSSAASRRGRWCSRAPGYSVKSASSKGVSPKPIRGWPRM